MLWGKGIMTRDYSDDIIASIAEITQHSDRAEMEASLASSLYKLLNINRAALYKIHYEYNQPKFTLALEVVNNKLQLLQPEHPPEKKDSPIAEKLQQCLLKKEATLTCLGTEESLYLQPILNHLNEVASIFILTGNETTYRSNEKLITYYFQIYRNYLKLLNESEYDTLTGLLNRRTFDRGLDKLITEWQTRTTAFDSNDENEANRRDTESKSSNWLAVVDVDFFKRINDNYGHLYGDEVLLLLANIMRNSFRNYDQIFRFGGEEFVVILHNTDYAGAEVALGRFHNKVGDYPFPQVGNITVSIGYEEIANQTVPSEVLRLADDALYYVKENGRNQVCCYNQLLAENKIQATQPPVRNEVELF